MSVNHPRLRHAVVLFLSAALTLCAFQRLHGQQATLPGTSTVERFLEQLQSGDRNERRRASYTTLRQIGPDDKAGVPLIVKAFETTDAGTRRSLVTALTQIGPAAVPDLADAATQNQEASVRLGAVMALGTIRAEPKSSVPCLIHALSDDVPAIRQSALTSLQRFGESADAAISETTAVALQDPEAQVRETAVRVLGHLRRRASVSVPCLGSALSDDNAGVRQAAAYAIAAFGKDAKPAVAALSRAMDDEQRKVQKTALEAVANLGSVAVEATPQLLKKIRDNDSEVSGLAALALRRVGVVSNDTAASLLEATQNPLPHVRRNAASALRVAQVSSERVASRLIELLKDEEQMVVQTALSALADLGPQADDAVGSITELTESEDRVVRAFARNALRRIVPDRAVELLGKPFDAVQAQRDDIEDFGVGKHDWPQLHGSRLRNNTPAGNNIPTMWNVGEFDRRTDEWDFSEAVNIKWVAKLGSQSYGNPVVANGRIYVGTNNGAGYLKRYPPEIDLGCLLCFRESDGAFLWQHSSEKLSTGRVHDWPLQGICSSPVVQGDRLWFVTNRGEVRCLDTEGFYDGEDDGPVTGVWNQLFDAVADFSATRDLSARGSIPSRLRDTLANVLRAAGLQIHGYLKIRAVDDSGVLTIGGFSNEPPLCRVRCTADGLTVLRLDQDEPLLNVNYDLLAGLEQGSLSPALRAQFSGKGVEMSGEITVRASDPGRAWDVTFSEQDQQRRFRLSSSRGVVTCEEQTTPASRDEADVVWTFDMMNQLGVSQHNMATCSPTIWGDTLFICTSNGVDESHLNIPAPDAPSFMAMDKHTGEVLWTDNSPGRHILHGQWSCPVAGVFNGVPQVIFPGGDGWLYSFRADRWKDGKPELIWKFDANPKESEWFLGGRGTRNNLIAVPVIYDGLVYAAVGQDPEHGEGDGHLWCIDPTKQGDVSAELVVDANGDVMPHRRVKAIVKEPIETIFRLSPRSEDLELDVLEKGQLPKPIAQAFEQSGYPLPKSTKIQSLDIGEEWLLTARIGDREHQFTLNAGRTVTAERETNAERVIANPNSAVVWHYDKFDINGDGRIDFEEEFHRTIGSPVIKEDLLVISDFSGLLHCMNAKTGIPYWTCDMFAQCWGTPLVVENKIYVGDEDGDVAVLGLSADPSPFVDPKSAPDWGGLFPLHEINMGTSVYQTPIVANDVLYIATKSHLFAIEAQEE